MAPEGRLDSGERFGALRPSLETDADTESPVVIAYERGDFDAAAALAERLGLRAETLAAAYGDALRYARELSRDVLAA